MRKTLLTIAFVTLSFNASAGVIADAERIGSNCEKIAEVMAQELVLAGEYATKEFLVRAAKLMTNNSNALAEKYYLISADAIYTSVRPGGNYYYQKRLVERGIATAGLQCKLEYAESAGGS